MKLLSRSQKKCVLIVSIIFFIAAFAIELVGISLEMYVYANTPFHIFDVPLTIIVYWIVIAHTSWVTYKKFGWIVGLLTGIIIDLPIEFLAFHLGWWTWIPSWTPAIFFSAPVANFLVYLSVSFGSIVIYRYIMKPKT